MADGAGTVQVLDRQQTKEVLRGVLHAVLFHRLFGTVRPRTFDVLDVAMVRRVSFRLLFDLGREGPGLGVWGSCEGRGRCVWEGCLVHATMKPNIKTSWRERSGCGIARRGGSIVSHAHWYSYAGRTRSPGWTTRGSRRRSRRRWTRSGRASRAVRTSAARCVRDICRRPRVHSAHYGVLCGCRSRSRSRKSGSASRGST